MMRLIVTLALTCAPLTKATESNPISKVVQMISELQATIMNQATDAQKAYEKYVAYCQERSQNLGFEVKTGKADKDNSKATIQDASATIESLTAKIEDISSDISSDESDLKAAASLRAKESADYELEEHDLKTIMDSLEGAISHFSKKDQASLLQAKSANSVTEALGVMVDALAISAEDASRLSALLQEHSLESTDQSDAGGDTDMQMGAPATVAYEPHTGSVVSTLEGLLERAEGQLSKVREAEATALHNYDKLRQALTNEISIAQQDMHATKVGIAESQEVKSLQAGDLEMTSRDLVTDLASKELLHHECMTAAQEFQQQVVARQDELKGLAAAKKAIEDNSDGAAQQTYLEQVSFAQVASRKTGHAASDSVAFQVIHLVRKLATKTKSAALAQLVSRMSSLQRLGAAGGSDPFEKVKSLITSMITTLESDADSEASHKVYCDQQMAATASEKEDTSTELESLTTKAHQKAARASKLKDRAASLQKELAAIAKAKAEASQLRLEQETAFNKNRAEMQKGLDGIRLALKIMKEHYGNSFGAEGGIVSLLEVVESDFQKGLTGLVVDEETLAHYYAVETKPNFELEIAAKENDLKLKKKAHISTNKAVSELGGDISGTQSRLAAILEFDETIKKTCSQPDSYEGRKRRREEELAGLKEALETLENDSLLQLSSSHKLRGTRPHSA